MLPVRPSEHARAWTDLCGDCGANKVKDNPALVDSLIAVGFKKKGLPCAGCRSLKGNCSVIGSTCETYACIDRRGFDFCFECPEFPCPKLNPASDRANVLPHNLKIFNLCFIQRQGVDRFLEMDPEIKRSTIVARWRSARDLN
jgi:hypothetical protein